MDNMINKKNIKVRSKKQVEDMQLAHLFQPAGNIAFLDAEFNSGMNYATGEKVNEIISIGFVICDMDFKECRQFYSLVGPVSNIPVFQLIREMTGITTEMLKGQPDFIEVSDAITEVLREFNVRKIYTWGAADKHSFMLEKELISQKKKSGYEQAHWGYIDMCTDISGAISSQMLGIRGGLSINMENLMFICDIDRVQEHNALSDAVNLFHCLSYLRNYYPVEKADRDFREKRELVNRYYQEKSLYNSFRRFRSTSRGSDLYGKWGDEDYAEDIRIQALEDDLRFLKGEISFDSEFDSIQDYFMNEKKR